MNRTENRLDSHRDAGEANRTTPAAPPRKGGVTLAWGSLFGLMLTLNCHGANISPTWLNHLAMVESGGGRWLVGDHQKSKGPYHMKASAWHDVTMARKAVGLQTWPWYTSRVSTLYANNFAHLLTERFLAEVGRYPTGPELYGLWSHGFEGARHHAFNPLLMPYRDRALSFPAAVNY
jgi:hypothetical protein